MVVFSFSIPEMLVCRNLLWQIVLALEHLTREKAAMRITTERHRMQTNSKIVFNHRNRDLFRTLQIPRTSSGALESFQIPKNTIQQLGIKGKTGYSEEHD